MAGIVEGLAYAENRTGKFEWTRSVGPIGLLLGTVAVFAIDWLD